MTIAPVRHIAVGPSALAAINTNVLDGVVSGYLDTCDAGFMIVQIIASAGISAGQIIFEGTNDIAATPVAVPVTEYTSASVTPAPVSGAFAIAASTARIFIVPIRYAWLRCRISTAFVGGTIRAVTLYDQRAAALPGSLANVQGQLAHDAPIAASLPVRMAGRARNVSYAAVANDDVADFVMTLNGSLITRDFAIPEQDWTFAAPSGGIIVATDVVLIGAGGAGLRRYLTAMDIRNASASVATEVVIKDGATVIWRGQFPVNSPFEPLVFPTPLKSSINAALNVQCITTAAQVYINAQGYTAA